MKINNIIMRIKDMKLREFQEGKPEWMSQEDWDKMNNPQKLPPGGKPKWMSQEEWDKRPRMKKAFSEEATAGATASGNIATVVNPHVANPSRKSVAYTGTPGVSGKGPVKQVKGGTYNTGKNALDGDDLLLADKHSSMIRRQIKEGSLYGSQTNASYHVDKMLVENPLVLGGLLIAAGVGGIALYKHMTSDAPDSAKSKVASAALGRLQRECASGVMPASCEKLKKIQGQVNEGLNIRYRKPLAPPAPTDEFSRGGRFDPKPGFGDVEGIPKPTPNVDTFSSKFKVPPKDPKPNLGNVEGIKKIIKKPKKIVPDEKHTDR